MARKKKGLVVLLGILLVLFVSTIIVKNIEEHKEAIKNIKDTVIDIDKDKIESIDWTYKNTSISLQKIDGEWKLSVDEDFPVDQELVAELTESLSKIDVAFIIEEVEDYNQYGLEDPDCKVVFKTAEEEYSLEFGDYSLMDEERYLNINDGNVYLMSNDIMDEFNLDIDDLFAYEEIPDITNCVEIIIAGENNQNIVYEEDNNYTYSKLFNYFLKSDNYKSLDNTLVKSLIRETKNLSFNDYVSYRATNTDLSAYGLENPRIKVEYLYLDENEEEKTFIIYLSSDIIPEDDEEMNCYARIEGSEIVYSIDEDILTNYLEVNYESYRPTNALLLEENSIKQITINLDEEEYVIVLDDDSYKYNEEEISLTDIFSALNDLEIVEYSDENAGKSLQIKLSIQLNNDEVLNLSFYKYNAENSILVFEGQYKALVDRQSVLDLIEDINEVVLD